MKEFMITKSSVVEIQNLVVNPKSQPIKSNSEQYQVTVPKLKIKTKKSIFGSFLPKGNFP